MSNESQNWSNNPNNPLLNEEVRSNEELKEANNTLPLETENKMDVAEVAKQGERLELLGQTKKESYDGDFLMGDNGGMFSENLKDRGSFRNVHSVWQSQCITFDQAKEVLAEQQANMSDIRCPLNEWEAGINEEGKVGLRKKATGRVYIPTRHCWVQIAQLGGGSSWQLHDLYSDKIKVNSKNDESVVFERDERDSKVLLMLLDLLLFQSDRIDLDKKRLFRTWDNDNSLRAILSEDYVILNNMWMIEQVESIIPGGLVSHWRGDADSIFGNVLIPDTIREETDSDYGGMVSIGNSEIGTRKAKSLPSVFRAICMNGCIWDHQQGKAFDFTHRRKDGKVDLSKLAEGMKNNVEQQIALIPDAMRSMLDTRTYNLGEANALQALCQTFKEFKIPKKVAKSVVVAFNEEAKILQDNANSAFGILNAYTRAGQKLSNEDWVKFDTIGGAIATMDKDRWGALMGSATKLDEKAIEKLVGAITTD